MDRFAGIGLVVFLALGVPTVAAAQGSPAGEIAGGYPFMWDNEFDKSFPVGWFVSGAGNLSDNFAIVGEVSGSHNSESNEFLSASADLNIYTYLAGVRFGGRSGAVTSFGQFLVGAARASASTSGLGFEESGSHTEFAIQPGAGVDIHLTEAVAARVIFDYRRISFEFEGGARNEIRVAAGIVVGFGSR